MTNNAGFISKHEKLIRSFVEKKPCLYCFVAVKQAADEGEVTCYQTCKDFRQWQQAESIKSVKAIRDNVCNPTRD